MDLHANAALSLNQRRRLARRVCEQGWRLADAAAAPLPDGRVLVGGGLGDGGVLPSAEIFALVSCRGRQATVVGNDRADQITSSPKADVIVGLGGNDKLSGLAGNDVICGGAGRDTLNGGKGKDKLYAEGGKDILKGGPSKDKQVQ